MTQHDLVGRSKMLANSRDSRPSLANSSENIRKGQQVRALNQYSTMILIVKVRPCDSVRVSCRHAMAWLPRKVPALRCRRLILKTIVGTFIASVLCLAPACSKQPSHESITLTFLDVEWDTPDRLPELARDLQDFTQETGILVKRLPRPDGSLDQLALWRQQLKKGGAAPDLVSIDVIWSAMLSQYLMDLKPYFATELSSQDPAVLSSYTVGDKVVAIPHHAYVGVFCTIALIFFEGTDMMSLPRHGLSLMRWLRGFKWVSVPGA
jgi:hypothetical protein